MEKDSIVLHLLLKSTFLIFQKIFIPCVIIVILISSPTISQDVTGNLTCQVIDVDDKAIGGAVLEVKSPNLQGTSLAQSNKDGYIRISILPPGYYTVTISHISYQIIVIDSVRIRMGKTNDLGQIKMISEPIPLQDIFVTDKKNLIDHTSTITGSNLSMKEKFKML